jgi:oxygen-independent coproporphyrinogen III oxidase
MDLAAKYDVPSPRYTSYPTVPYWSDSPTAEQWSLHLRAAMVRQQSSGAGLGIYVHLPFCRSLCTYCGCNTRVTRSHVIVRRYVRALLDEYALYRRQLRAERPLLGELHLGGGTPTFLDCAELAELLGGLLGASTLASGAELSVEVDPRACSDEQLALLAQYGFRRISVGVQDFDQRVQAIVNRVQSEAQVRRVFDAARRLGYSSVNADLIYGLPLQTVDSVRQTMQSMCRLRPDRIAFYGYAHVPWMRPGQRRFDESHLATGAARCALYETGREALEAAGYRELGMDHFALQSDSLWRAAESGRMHRNFMGYTHLHTEPLLGLGASAIGDAGDAFAQNDKDTADYLRRIEAGELPIARGHRLTAEDRVLRRHITRLMTQLETDWSEATEFTPLLGEIAPQLQDLADDGLVEHTASGCRVTAAGRRYLRNICVPFDARMARRPASSPLFSRSA